MRICSCTIALIALALTSCARQTPTASPPLPADVLISEVSMSRTGCFGECPVYSVGLRWDGEVVFEGREYVKMKGRNVRTIAKEDFAFLVQALERSRFFEMHDSYWEEEDGCKETWTDNPSVYISATRAGVKKRVSYNYGCRGLPTETRIKSLSVAIDQIAGIEEWIGSDTGAL